MSIKNATPPPIKVWIWLGISYIIIQIIILFFYYKEPLKGINKKLNYQLSTIETEFENCGDRTYKVVVIGSSLTRHAIECTNQLLTAPIHNKKMNIQLTKIWFHNDPFKSLIENTQLIEKLILLNPDLICFQTEFLTTILKPQNTSLLKQESFIKKKINEISHINTTFINNLNFRKKRANNNLYGSETSIHHHEKIDTLNHKPIQKEVKKISNLKYAFKGLLPLKKAKIKMTIIDIPRPQKINNNSYSEVYNNNLKELLSVYKKELSIDYWSYTGNPMYFKHFIDGGHLNVNGSDIYTQWLLTKIEMNIK